MKQFSMKTEESEMLHDTVIYETHVDELEKFCNGELLKKNGMYELYQMPEGKFIVYHWATCRFAFGFWLEDLESEYMVRCYFHPNMDEQIPLDAVRFFSCTGLHSKLLQKGGLVFHSAYVDWNGKGILFAGPSGVGKSTQANLWKTYADAEIINGDRTLLRKKSEKWYCYGYPCCGSSSVCINRTLPLLAIVLLEHGNANYVEELTMSQKMRLFLSGSEMYLWNMKELDRVHEIAKKLVEEIMIIKLVCRPEKEAVFMLKHTLENYKIENECFVPEQSERNEYINEKDI